jgi:hypothetical protein
MPPLDITTPRGQSVVEDQKRAVAIFEANFPGLRFEHTSKTQAEPVAGRVYSRKSGKLKGLVILRCRYNCDRDFFEGKWRSEWLVTHAKIEVAKKLCHRERATLMGFLYIKRDDVLAVRTMYDPSLPDPWIEPKVKPPKIRETQATVNGGRDEKLNSMVPMHKAKRWLTMPVLVAS